MPFLLPGLQGSFASLTLRKRDQRASFHCISGSRWLGTVGKWILLWLPRDRKRTGTRASSICGHLQSYWWPDREWTLNTFWTVPLIVLVLYHSRWPPSCTRDSCMWVGSAGPRSASSKTAAGTPCGRSGCTPESGCLPLRRGLCIFHRGSVVLPNLLMENLPLQYRLAWIALQLLISAYLFDLVLACSSHKTKNSATLPYFGCTGCF